MGYSSEDIVEGGLRFSHNCIFSVVAVAVHGDDAPKLNIHNVPLTNAP